MKGRQNVALSFLGHNSLLFVFSGAFEILEKNREKLFYVKSQNEQK